MDYFAYKNKKRIKESQLFNSLPSTPTILIHDTGKSSFRPTCIRYSTSFFDKEPSQSLSSLSSSLPSPPTTPQVPLILPSLSLPSPSALFKRRFSNPPKRVISPRLHVLLVDDNAVNLQILSRLLSTHMPDVFEHIELVKSGVKALELLRCRPFDLILMDIDMPILNGVETARHIRSSTEFDILLHNRNIPIVAVTTNDTKEWRELYTNAGMNGCIGKPVSLNDLKSTLSNVLDLDIPQSPYTPE
ncbi:CheY-like protein [Rhizopus microsporus var. microsporus]|uniref:CheY-like protein n=3 Tax=Rhizopus TaxID=4842 RepID=A0A2G4T0R0_RHIZD|nr:CheY-like protein [Rhizopus microsporus ATCC 52813]ORE04742.1 CheY-like protein [Rhizopus microsporus var. microsporus]PHZ14577.1 CheY-like protein [Rhizopus microsporus ATCC 52813]